MINTKTFPTAFFEKIILDSVEQAGVSQTIKASLTMSVKAEREAETGGFRRLVDKAMSMKVLQVQDPNLAAFLATSRELVYYAANPSKMPAVLPIVILQLAYSRELIKTRPTTNTMTSATLELKKTFSDVSKIVSKEISNLESQQLPTVGGASAKNAQRVETINNEQLLSTYFKISFDSPASTQHLTYFAFIQQQTTRTTLAVPDISVMSEVALNSGKLVTQAYVYSLPDGKIWNGPVHLDGNTWKTGKLRDPERNKATLQRRLIFNNKLQDNRIYTALSKNRFAFQQEKPSLIKENITYERAPIQWLTKNANGFSFFVNINNLLKKNSKAYDIFARFSINDLNWIRSINIYRKRVKKVGDKIVPFTKNEVPTLISTSITSRITGGVAYFDVVDNDLAQIQVGQYAYIVSITFEDPLVKIAKAERNKLFSQENYSFIQTYRNETQTNETDSSSGNYDLQLDKFTAQFVERYQQDSRIANSIDSFVDSYNKISPRIISSDSDIKTNIVKQISPSTGTRMGLDKFIKVYENTANIYDKLFNQVKKSSFFKEDITFDKEEMLMGPSEPQLSARNYGMRTAREDAIVNALRQMENMSVSIRLFGSSEPIINDSKEKFASLTENSVLLLADFVSDTLSAINSAAARVPNKTRENLRNLMKDVVRNQINTVSRPNLSDTRSATTTAISPVPSQLFATRPGKVSPTIQQDARALQRSSVQVDASLTSTRTVSENTISDLVAETINKKVSKELNTNISNTRGRR